ncbi:MAG: OsmC family peroxiredoxin, partial [Halomonas sp.]|nr:OsmC family peroxiredoxin [Halomonas sp.]
YIDNATGRMIETTNGSGYFESVTLKPSIRIGAADDSELATSLHDKAHSFCFIANSVNFDVGCEPEILTG